MGISKYYSEPLVDIYCGHALEVLKGLPDESVQMCITSPPFWGLRNYAGGSDILWGGDPNCEHAFEGSEYHEHRAEEVIAGKKSRTTERFYGSPSRKFNNDVQRHWSDVFCMKCGAYKSQLGLEPRPELYVEHLMQIFREVKRVLKRAGSFWLNIGDTYSANRSYQVPQTKWQSSGDDVAGAPMKAPLQPKCMVCIPERVMFAMIEDGWILRNKCIWRKLNPMPSSVKDRFTTTYEFVYFFVKAGRYYFDLDAVRVPHQTLSLERYQRGVNLGRPAEGKSGEVGPMQQYTRAPQWFKDTVSPDKDYRGKFDNPELREESAKKGQLFDQPIAHQGDRRKSCQPRETGGHELPPTEGDEAFNPKGKNPGDVLECCGDDSELMQRHHGSEPQYKLSGIGRGLTKHHDSSHHGRAGFDNLTKHDQAVGRTGNVAYTDPLHTRDYSPKGKNPGDILEISTQPSKVKHYAAFPERLCETPIKACSKVGDVVLDMFCGSGTTGVVAKKLGRKAILIDCVESYCKISKERVTKVEYQPELG